MLFLYEKCVSCWLNLYSWIQHTVQYTSWIGNHHLGISSLCEKKKVTNVSVSASLLPTESSPSNLFWRQRNVGYLWSIFLALKMPFYRYEINVSSQLSKIKKKLILWVINLAAIERQPFPKCTRLLYIQICSFPTHKHRVSIFFSRKNYQHQKCSNWVCRRLIQH